jgi:hypothetical protein
MVRDDIEWNLGRRDHFSRYFLAFDVIIISATKYVWSFRHVPLLSYDYPSVT